MMFWKATYTKRSPSNPVHNIAQEMQSHQHKPSTFYSTINENLINLNRFLTCPTTVVVNETCNHLWKLNFAKIKLALLCGLQSPEQIVIALPEMQFSILCVWDGELDYLHDSYEIFVMKSLEYFVFFSFIVVDVGHSFLKMAIDNDATQKDYRKPSCVK